MRGIRFQGGPQGDTGEGSVTADVGAVTEKCCGVGAVAARQGSREGHPQEFGRRDMIADGQPEQRVAHHPIAQDRGQFRHFPRGEHRTGVEIRDLRQHLFERLAVITVGITAPDGRRVPLVCDGQRRLEVRRHPRRPNPDRGQPDRSVPNARP